MIKHFLLAILAILVIMLLTGCGTTSRVSFIEAKRPVPKIDVPPPLNPLPVTFKLLEHDDVVYFSLDSNNYENLAKNTEDVQNRLFYYHKLIDSLQDFNSTRNK